MKCRAIASVVVAMVCVLGRPAAAQDYAPATQDYAHSTPAHISLVDGAAVLERDGQVDRDPRSMPLLAGDRIRTEGGRVEVLFPDGSALHLDTDTIIDFQSDEVVRLLRGRLRLSIAGPARDVFYRIDAPSAWVEIHEAGEYRVAVPREGDVELAVLRGSAELVNEQGRSHIRAGEQTFARAGAAPSQAYVFNSAAWDSFDRWSEDRRSQRLGRSAQYLPSDVRPYAGTFDTYGAWRHEPAHGYVWYPRVAAGWRPYFHGRWVSLRPYGWTWVAADPWGWPTHHFGRWGFSAGAWFWIPGRHWGPAWVSWAYTPHFVTWCPLGWNNRPVVQIVNVNIGVGRRFSPWHAWTVVPRRHFSGSFVNVAAIGSVRIDRRIQNTFVIRDRAPETRFAVSRDSAPIRSAGRFAVPRSGAASESRSADSGRRLTSPGGSGATGERRFPAPARAPGSVSSQRSAGGSAAAPPGGRAVAREPDAAGAAPTAAGRARSTQQTPAGGGRTAAREADAAGTAPNAAGRARSSQQTPAAGGRAVAREADAAGTAPIAAGRARSTQQTPAAGGRAVAREADAAGTAPIAAGRARSTEQPPSATPGRPASAAGTRQAAPAGEPARATETAPPAGAVRVVPRTRTPSAESAPAARPDQARPSAGAPTRSRSSSPSPAQAAPAAPSAAPVSRGRPRAASAPSASPAGPAARSAAPVRTRPSSTAPAARPAPAEAAPPRSSIRRAPASRGSSDAAPAWGRATPRSQSAPAAPAARATPERRAPAASAPAASAPAASPSSARSAGRSTPSAGARSRQRSAEASSSGQRGRRRE